MMPDAARSSTGRGRRRRPAVVHAALAGLVILAGCGLIRPRPLDVAPGQHVVLGRVDLTLFDAREVLVDIVREDGAFSTEFYVGFGAGNFAMALPPGHYRLGQVRTVDQRLSFPNTEPRYLRVVFDVGPEPAVYVGTLRLTLVSDRTVTVTVVDEYATTVPALRALYTNIPADVARALFRPA